MDTLPLVNPYSAMAELSKLNSDLVSGIKNISTTKDADIQIGTTEKEEVFKQDKASLYHYKPLAEQQTVTTPVIVVYGLIGRYTMADLQEDRSLVRNMLSAGIDINCARCAVRHLTQPDLVAPLRNHRTLLIGYYRPDHDLGSKYCRIRITMVLSGITDGREQ